MPWQFICNYELRKLASWNQTDHTKAKWIYSVTWPLLFLCYVTLWEKPYTIISNMLHQSCHRVDVPVSNSAGWSITKIKYESRLKPCVELKLNLEKRSSLVVDKKKKWPGHGPYSHDQQLLSPYRVKDLCLSALYRATPAYFLLFRFPAN